MAAVREMLERPEVRLLTLTGPGGAGKTRLALRVAEEATGRFPDGVRFVPLAPLVDADLVLPAVARSLGVREAGTRSLVDGLRVELGDGQALLVLDNFEHVASAAPELVELLTVCPGLTLLVTSRALLRISGEHGYAVPPMSAPDPSGNAPLDASDAVRLFADRARAVDPGFAITAENGPEVAAICRRLDGLPLAIELAAARSNLLPPAALLARLGSRLPLLTGGPRDQPARLRTLRDAIAWSYDLLTPEEQVLFRHLSVFAGGFTLEAAEAIAGEGVRGTGGEENASPSYPHTALPPALDEISSLVDKSLLVRFDRPEPGQGAEPRFGMLETVREFALEELAATGGEHEVRAAHATYCLTLAERDQRTMAWQEMAGWFDKLQGEHDNLRAALAWLERSGDVAGMLRLAGPLAWFWLYRSHRAEGRRWLERALAAAEQGATPDGVRAWALHGAALLTRTLGDDAQARRMCTEALELYRGLGDAWGTAVSLNLLGSVARSRGELDEARAFGEEALPLFTELEMARWEARVRAHLGIVAHWQGDEGAAEPLLRTALNTHREMNDQIGSAIVLHWLAAVAADRGDHSRAADLERESLGAANAAGAKEAMLDSLAGLAAVAAASGRSELAVRLMGAVEAHCERLGYAFERLEQERLERGTRLVRESLGEDAFARAEKAGRVLSLEDAVAEATASAPSAQPDGASVGARLAARHGLTAREVDVLGLLAHRRTDREIAEELFISPKTAGFHVANILGKLGVANRREAAAFALREGITATAS